MKMDHHCPWINACCGHLNHGYFLHFIHWAPIGCTVCAIMLASAIYHDWKSLPYVLLRRSSSQFLSALTNLLLNIFAFGLAVGVSLAVGTLAVYQLLALRKNQTAIESWIVAKANHWRSETGEKPFVYPYDLGWRNNLSQVLTLSGCAIGDGIHWPLRDGCGEYDFTAEQIRQKEMKQLIRRDYLVSRSYNGRYCPCCQFSCSVALNTPYPDEPRLRVNVGDTVAVTRWSKHWMYGELQPSKPSVSNGVHSDTPAGPRGWFPRACATKLQSTQGSKYSCNRPKQD
ncbi:Palmitoyltransferase [Paragonimus heterotremus]|uniref:Palmitoyltransferase n=1 Tax=Paragonimus heterotremus TaxID=100268 RepID=A0A8J4TGS3_9TREM|nr:Palmitoyltransferase [Paragonimus heterotremus]